MRVVGLLAVTIFSAAGAAAAADAPAPGELPLLSAPRTRPAVSPRAADAEAATYQRCLTLAKEDPAAAKKLAEGWRAGGGAHPADHCLAVSLVGLKDYKNGAARLDKLGQAMVSAPAGLRADVFDQAAQAWLLAGEPGRAYAAAGAALGLRPGDVGLLVDRAEAAGAAAWYGKAVEDLDRVLKAEPTRFDALVYRATAYRKLGRLDPALADIEAALRVNSDAPAALLERGNIRALRGDVDGARQDWARVVALAPGGGTEAAAKANIAQASGERAAAPSKKAAR